MRKNHRVFRLKSKVLGLLSLPGFLSLLPLLSLLLLASSACAEPIRDWDWHLSAEQYKNLDFSVRAGVDRAGKLFETAVWHEQRGEKVTDLVPRYRAAAGEWRKVQVESETSDGDEALLAYAVFMQGYARQQAHDRNEAIKLYTEVLDLYPEQKFIAVPARYMISCVRRELGDIRQADEDLAEIAEDPAADGHIIYYNVLLSLGRRRWDAGRTDEAIDLWRRIVFTKGKPNDSVWRAARGALAFAYFVALDAASYDEMLFLGVDEKDLKRRRDIVADSANWFYNSRRGWPPELSGYIEKKFPREKKSAEHKELWQKFTRFMTAWVDGKAAIFEGGDDGWRFAYWQLRVRATSDPSFEKFVKKLESLAKGAKKPGEADERIRTLAYALLEVGQADRARQTAQLAKDTLYRLNLQADVECWLGAWKNAAQFVYEYINVKPGPSVDALKGAKYRLADLYHNRLGEHEKAIKIYQDLNDPPRSLWGLGESQRSAGKKKDAYATLTEIASVFPDDAANAVYRMAEWRESDGDKTKAIALYRQLLSHPKWKQSGASSRAHQALERLGVATGGAMTNEVR